MTSNLSNRFLNSNMHPADALLELREEIRALQDIEQKLRDQIINDKDMRNGAFAQATVTSTMVKRLDREKIQKLVEDMDQVTTPVETTYVRVKLVRS